MTAAVLVGVTGYSAYWIGQITRRYNRDRPDGVRDRMACGNLGYPDDTGHGR